MSAERTYIMKKTEIILPKESVLGEHGIAIPKKIADTKEYENGKATGKILGTTITVTLPEKNFEEINVKLPMVSSADFPSNEEIELAASNLDFYEVVFEDFTASLSLHNDIEGKSFKKQAYVKYTAKNAVIQKANEKTIDLG